MLLEETGGRGTRAADVSHHAACQAEYRLTTAQYRPVRATSADRPFKAEYRPIKD